MLSPFSLWTSVCSPCLMLFYSLIFFLDSKARLKKNTFQNPKSKENHKIEVLEITVVPLIQVQIRPTSPKRYSFLISVLFRSRLTKRRARSISRTCSHQLWIFSIGRKHQRHQLSFRAQILWIFSLLNFPWHSVEFLLHNKFFYYQLVYFDLFNYWVAWL